MSKKPIVIKDSMTGDVLSHILNGEQIQGAPQKSIAELMSLIEQSLLPQQSSYQYQEESGVGWPVDHHYDRSQLSDEPYPEVSGIDPNAQPYYPHQDPMNTQTNFSDLLQKLQDPNVSPKEYLSITADLLKNDYDLYGKYLRHLDDNNLYNEHAEKLMADFFDPSPSPSPSPSPASFPAEPQRPALSQEVMNSIKGDYGPQIQRPTIEWLADLFNNPDANDRLENPVRKWDGNPAFDPKHFNDYLNENAAKQRMLWEALFQDVDKRKQILYNKTGQLPYEIHLPRDTEFATPLRRQQLGLSTDDPNLFELPMNRYIRDYSIQGGGGYGHGPRGNVADIMKFIGEHSPESFYQNIASQDPRPMMMIDSGVSGSIPTKINDIIKSWRDTNVKHPDSWPLLSDTQMLTGPGKWQSEAVSNLPYSSTQNIIGDVEHTPHTRGTITSYEPSNIPMPNRFTPGEGPFTPKIEYAPISPFESSLAQDLGGRILDPVEKKLAPSVIEAIFNKVIPFIAKGIRL